MSAYEDPVTTIIRLLSKKIQVIKDDNSIATIYVSKEWYDRELFKNYDAQISVGLAQSQDEKLEISGRIRRRIGRLRVNIWATDRPQTSDPGRTMRQKIVEEVNRVVRQNMKTPNQAFYDFSGLGYPSGDPHKAYDAGAASELVPSSNSWSELSVANYQKLWSSDDIRHSKSTSVNNQYALMLFRFKLGPREQSVKKIMLAFEGYATGHETAPGRWVSPDGFSDPDSFWDYENLAYDTLITTSPWCEIPGESWSSFLYLTLASGIQCNKLKAYLSLFALPGFSPIDIDVYRDGAWVHVFEGDFTENGWNEFSFGQGLVTQMRIRGYNSNVGSSIPNCLREVYFWQVPEIENGITIKVWNHVASAWQNAQTGTGGADETITITLTTSITDYIDDSGYVWLLARTTNPSNGTTAAIIYCDYVSCTVMVNGITYLDVVSFRDADRVDTKPIIFRTEFVLKSWSFEDIGGVF
jgi:hypothetical protein